MFLIMIVADFNDFNQNQYCTNENLSNDVFLRPDGINRYKTNMSRRLDNYYIIIYSHSKCFLVTLRKKLIKQSTSQIFQ